MLQTAFKCIALFCFTLAIIACARTQTSGTESLLPANSKVLVILAHPDDETWMSGTLARLSAEGHSVQVLYASSGDKGRDASGAGLAEQRLADQREQEAVNALKSLGIDSAPLFLRLPDGQLNRLREKMTEQLSNIIAPQTQLLISFGDRGITGHPDHIAVKAASEALYQQLYTQGTAPIFWQAIFSEDRNRVAVDVAESLNHPFRIPAPSKNTLISRTVDVSGFQTQRLAAFRQHKTQFPESMHALWLKFIENSTYEEFHEYALDSIKNQ